MPKPSGSTVPTCCRQVGAMRWARPCRRSSRILALRPRSSRPCRLQSTSSGPTRRAADTEPEGSHVRSGAAAWPPLTSSGSGANDDRDHHPEGGDAARRARLPWRLELDGQPLPGAGDPPARRLHALPHISTIVLSFQEGFDNYVRLFTRDPAFLDLSTFPPSGALFNNLLWVVFYTGGCLIFGLLVAVMATRVRYEAGIKAIVFIPQAIAADGPRRHLAVRPLPRPRHRACQRRDRGLRPRPDRLAG